MSKLVYINIDGFSYSYYQRLKSEGKSAIFDQLASDGIHFCNLASGLVSITNPMQSAILCGAFSNRTHNFYQHYDKELKCVVKHKRTFDATNVAEVFVQHGKTVASIHQFMLEDNPCVEGDPTKAYIKHPNQPSNFLDRFDLLKKVALGESVYSGEKELKYDTFPDFLALYIDDIDTLGHNNAYRFLPERNVFEDRQKDIINCLVEIQQQLKEFVDICKQRGIYDDLTIIVTTDHGMTPFWGKSKLPELIAALNAKGIKVATADTRTEETEIVALPYTIEVSLYFVKQLNKEKLQTIDQVLHSLDYVDRVFYKEEMEKYFGFDERGPEILISPKYGLHFYKRDIEEGTFAASHDSFHPTSQHIFGIVFGNKIAKNIHYLPKTSVISLIPSTLASVFDYKLPQSTAKILDFPHLKEE